LTRIKPQDDWRAQQNFVLLESVRSDKANRLNLLFTDPVDIITCHDPQELTRCFRQIESCRQKGFYLAGFLAYELGYLLEESLNGCYRKQNYPLIWLGVFNRPRILSRPIAAEDQKYYLSPPVFNVSRAEYEKNIGIIKEFIARGDTYQINYTGKYKFDFWGDAFAFYNRLKEKQKVSYSALINYGGNYLVSLSPELFFRIDKNRRITVKPMKGTAPQDSGNWLASDEKNKSENVMIVDLLRNDIGRICQPGSVLVKRLFEIEEYETVQQMTSTVQGKLLPETGITDIIKSLFPCGSVTGAPKINSMKIIRKLEKEPRGIYTGAIGYFAPDNSVVFNVAIRTIDLRQKDEEKYSAQMGIGGGIVADSRPHEEYKECLLKGHFLVKSRPAFALIETMLCVRGNIKYLAAHLKRLKTSARYFHIPCNARAIKQDLQKYAAKRPGICRLRLLMDSCGKTSFEHAALVIPDNSSRRIAVSPLRTDSHDLFLRHKTTLRDLYNAEYKKYKAQGYFDVIFCNEKDEITEGAISNIFFEKNGRLYTPPLSCGLLNGIGRELMMKKRQVKEKILYISDLKKADRIYLTNSVRGVNEVFWE